MARPQEFNHQKVLNDAMQVFWRKGYSTTSIKDLSSAMQLQPGSIYGAFKNKRNLFIESLDYYFINLYEGVKNILDTEEAPLLRIRKFFDYFLNVARDDEELKSCLLVNTLLEIPPEDEEINERVSVMFQKVEVLFVKVLVEAQQNGSLVSGTRPESAAKMLMSGIFGLQVYNRMRKDKDSLKQIVNNLLSVLEKA